jgi:hypothetical protein
MTEPIRLKKDEGIVEVLFNRPEAFNAFDLEPHSLRVSHRARASRTVLLCSSPRRAGRIKVIFREAKTEIQPQMNLICF